MILMVGASGFIGSRLLEHYKKRGVSAVGTYCKNFRKGLIYYNVADIKENDLDFIDESCRFGIIAVSIGSIDYHKLHISEYLRVNKSIKKIISVLNSKRAIPVFLSTDYVFEGVAGDYKEDDPVKPTTEYGKSKTEIEEYLKTEYEDYIIIRLGKVYGHSPGDGTLLTGIISKLQRGETIKAADDQIIAPTSVIDAVSGISKIIDSGHTGIFHISSPEVRSRYEVSALIKEKMQWLKGSVEKVGINDLFFAEKRPLNTTMNSDKTSEMFGITYTSIEDNILKIEREYNEKKVQRI